MQPGLRGRDSKKGTKHEGVTGHAAFKRKLPLGQREGKGDTAKWGVHVEKPRGMGRQVRLTQVVRVVWTIFRNKAFAQIARKKGSIKTNLW